MQPTLLSVKTTITEVAAVVVNLIGGAPWSVEGRNSEYHYLFSLFSDYQLEYLENECLDEVNFCFLDYSTRLNLKFT